VDRHGIADLSDKVAVTFKWLGIFNRTKISVIFALSDGHLPRAVRDIRAMFGLFLAEGDGLQKHVSFAARRQRTYLRFWLVMRSD